MIIRVLNIEISSSRTFYRVVGFEVEPKSIDSKRVAANTDGTCTIQTGKELQRINPDGTLNSMRFEEYVLFCSFSLFRRKHNYHNL